MTFFQRKRKSRFEVVIPQVGQEETFYESIRDPLQGGPLIRLAGVNEQPLFSEGLLSSH